MVRPLTPAAESATAGARLDDARGLAAFASDSFSTHGELTPRHHPALLPADSFGLDLSDPAQRQFGDYELLEQIGEGGMGVVYRARQVSLDREVALKLLSAGPWASKEFTARFEREAQNAARIQHPNIVTIYEVGNIEGLQFFSMRLVRGASLAVKLRAAGPFSPRAAASLMRTIAEAVDYAHRLGVLHLDLKPSNVLLDEAGVPYVADFGLARRLENVPALDHEEVSGTPSYMAPEQTGLHAHKLTAAADIWGLGAILYELLTAHPPFQGPSARATVELARAGVVRVPRRWRPSLPLDIEAIVLRCLELDPARRYPSARALADDLGRFIEGRPVQARPLNRVQRALRWVRREPRLAVTALLAFATLAIGLATTTQQWYRAEQNARIARSHALIASQRLWDSRSAAALTAMAARNDWEAAPLLLANLATMEAQGDGERAAITRRRLGIIRNTNPVLIDAIPVLPGPVAVAFDPEGKRVAVSGQETGLGIYDTATGEEILRKPGVAHEVLTRLQFTADGRVLLGAGLELSSQSPRPAGRRMRRLDLERGVWLEPPPGFADLRMASYSRDGRFAVLTTNEGRAQFWATDPWRSLGPLAALPYNDLDDARLIMPDGSGFALAGPRGAVTLMDARSMRATHVALGEFGRIAAWTVSPDSNWLALGDIAGHVVVVNRRTLTVRALQPQPAFGARWLTFSEDGGWLALAAGAGGVYLWSWPEARLLVPPFGANVSPGGMPLAERVDLDPARNLVLISDQTANTSIWQVAPTNIEGDLSGAQRITAGIAVRESWAVEAVGWNPKTGLLASIADKRLRLERLRPPALKSGYGAWLQPATLHFDGRHLVEVNGSRVQIVDAMSEQPIRSPVRFEQPVGFAELTPDSATLVVIAGRRLHVLDAASGKHRFPSVEIDDSPSLVDLSPDGQRVAVAWLTNDARADRVTSEMVVIYSLVDGRRLGGPQALPGPSNEIMAFSDDGARLLVWNPRELAVRDGVSLAPVSGPLADFRPRGRDPDSHHGYVRSAAFDATGGLELVFSKEVDGNWSWELRRYARDGSRRVIPLPSMNHDLHLLPLPDGQGTVVTGSYSPLTRIVATDGSSQSLPEKYDDGASLAAALSPDGRWLARALRDGVELFDLHNREPAAVLHVALPDPDSIEKLAYSPDGNRLLARSVRSRFIVWDLAPDPRPVAVIARALGLRDLSGADAALVAGLTRDPDTREHPNLRAEDPGPPREAVMPASSTASILPRDPATPPGALDLSAHYTFGFGNPLTEPPDSADFGWIPVGLQRLQGVDYDLRGGTRLARGHLVHIELGKALEGRRISALHVLVAEPVANSEIIATLGIRYPQGKHVELPLRIADDGLGYWRRPGTDESVRIAGFGNDARAALPAGDDRGRAYLLQFELVNPHPEWPVHALDLRASGTAVQGVAVLAVSLQADAAGARRSGAAMH